MLAALSILAMLIMTSARAAMPLINMSDVAQLRAALLAAQAELAQTQFKLQSARTEGRGQGLGGRGGRGALARGKPLKPNPRGRPNGGQRAS